MIETSLKFTQIIRILLLVTPLGCHPISFSCCVIRKNAKTYYHSYLIIIGAADTFCHKNALSQFPDETSKFPAPYYTLK